MHHPLPHQAALQSCLETKPPARSASPTELTWSAKPTGPPPLTLPQSTATSTGEIVSANPAIRPDLSPQTQADYGQARHRQPPPARSRQPAKPGRIRRFLLVLLAILMLVPTVQIPSDAYTVTTLGHYILPPNAYYHRNTSHNTHNGTLSLYFNPMHAGETARRYRISAPGGSGDGRTTDGCETDRGPLPRGAYGRGATAESATFDFMYKTWGDQTVAGWVWQLGSKRCSGPSRTLRWGLYIHSQGYSGWSGSYRTEGCIKINQVDRSFMATNYINAYSRQDGRLIVNG